jgi:hypothetical protein
MADDAITYGLVAAGISVAIIAVVQGIGSKPQSSFQPASQSTTQPVDWATRCSAYSDLKVSHPDVYAYLESQRANLPQCNG